MVIISTATIMCVRVQICCLTLSGAEADDNISLKKQEGSLGEPEYRSVMCCVGPLNGSLYYRIEV